MRINTKQFKSKEELYQYLVHNKQEIIDLKKGVLKKADQVTHVFSSVEADAINKSYLNQTDEKAGILKRTIIANTYKWMDSHDDVHADNLFAKSIKERGIRTPHLHDHKFELSARVGNALKIYETEIKWKELGVSKSGSTMALFLESEILKEYNEVVYRDYLNKRIDQHSVGMQYVKIELAINDEDYEPEYKVWKSVIDTIGNKERAEEQGYFWLVKEAKLIEVSAVLLGSNELTPTMDKQPSLETVKDAGDQPKKLSLNADELINFYQTKFKK